MWLGSPGWKKEDTGALEPPLGGQPGDTRNETMLELPCAQAIE